MGSRAARFLAEYMKNRHYSVEAAAARLEIPVEKLTSFSGEPLTADELLRLCQYLHIKPERIPLDEF